MNALPLLTRNSALITTSSDGCSLIRYIVSLIRTGRSTAAASQASSLNNDAHQVRFDAKPEALIHIDATELEIATSIKQIKNQGSLQGQFTALGHPPVITEIAGRKAIEFKGDEVLRASFPPPRQWSGNSSYTVEAMVFNPEIAEAEAIISWCGRGGPDGMTGQVGYGSHPVWGAVGHWGFADMGYRNGPP